MWASRESGHKDLENSSHFRSSFFLWQHQETEVTHPNQHIVFKEWGNWILWEESIYLWIPFYLKEIKSCMCFQKNNALLYVAWLNLIAAERAHLSGQGTVAYPVAVTMVLPLLFSLRQPGCASEFVKFWSLLKVKSCTMYHCFPLLKFVCDL